jgi:hypothetical protein
MAGTYAKYSGLTGPGGGGGGGGVTSINGNTNPAQTISGGTGITVTSAGGTTTITNAGALDAFTILQADHGTFPTATTPNSAADFHSSDSSVTITGNSSTNTLNFQVSATTLGGTSSNTPNTLVLRDSTGSAYINNENVDTFFPWTGTFYLLTESSSYSQIMTGGGPSDQNLAMPNATTLLVANGTGWEVRILNNTNNFNQIDVYAFDQTTLLTTVGPFSAVVMICVDNTTTNGTWNTFAGIPTGATWSATGGINLGDGSTITSNAGGVGTTASIGLFEYFTIVNDIGNTVLVVGAPVGDTHHWEINDNDGNESIQIDFRQTIDSSGNPGVSWDVGAKQLFADGFVLAFDWNEMQFFYPATTNLIAAMGYNTEFDTAVVHLSSIDFGASLCTVATGTGAGTGGSVTLGADSNDLNGQVNLTTGTLPSVSSKVFTITLAHDYGAAPQSLHLFPLNAASALATTSVYYSFATSTSTTVDVYSTTTALIAATAYKWSYMIVE